MAKSPPKKEAHKRGANRNELAAKKRKTSNRFNLTRDVREDRGTRQTKLGTRRTRVY
ncbi:MAG: hypothetical protein U1F57_10510 [bacterium]